MNFSTYFLSLLKLLLLLQRIRPHKDIILSSFLKYTLLCWETHLGRRKGGSRTGAAPGLFQCLVQSPYWWRWEELPLSTYPFRALSPSPLPACPAPTAFGPGRMRPSLCWAQIATRKSSPCHVCCKLRHAFPVSAQHLSSLGRHKIAEGPIRCVLDPPSPGDPPSSTMHGTLNFNPAVPFVWRGETIYEESYKINTKSSP